VGRGIRGGHAITAQLREVEKSKCGRASCSPESTGRQQPPNSCTRMTCPRTEVAVAWAAFARELQRANPLQGGEGMRSRGSLVDGRAAWGREG